RRCDMTDSRRSRRHPSRIGSMLVAVGCLGLLGIIFGAGFYTGRYWTRASMAAAPLGTPSAMASASVTPAHRGAGPLPPTPALTFYEELTAPLPVPSVPPRAPANETRHPAESPTTRSEEKVAKGDRPADVPPMRRSQATGVEAPPGRRSELTTVAPRFTVQLAAYSARASAEALRNTVSAAGVEAYIVESDIPPGAPRYRVRVGSYPTREAAMAAASRLPVPGPLYVTTR